MLAIIFAFLANILFFNFAYADMETELVRTASNKTKKYRTYEALEKHCMGYVYFKINHDSDFHHLKDKEVYCQNLSDSNSNTGLHLTFGESGKKLDELYKMEALKIKNIFDDVPFEQLSKLIKRNVKSVKEYVQSFHQMKFNSELIDLDFLFGIDYEKAEYSVMESSEVKKNDLFIGAGRWASQTPYESIREVLSQLKFVPGETVMDLGSGYGRFILYSAVNYSHINFVGVEIVKERAQESEKVKKVFDLRNVKIINSDVLNVDFSQANYFYFFNPFPEIMGKVLKKLHKESSKNRKVCGIFRNTYISEHEKIDNWLKYKKLLKSKDSFSMHCNRPIVD